MSTDLPPAPPIIPHTNAFDDIVEQVGRNKIDLSGGVDEKLQVLGSVPSPPKYPLAIEYGKINQQEVAVGDKLPPAIIAAPQNGMAKFANPTGLLAATLSGVASLVGVVWLFDNIRGPSHNRRKAEELSKKRPHAREWKWVDR